MTFSEIAIRMYPSWIMGLFMLFTTYNSKYKNLLRVELKPTLKWLKILAIITIIRIVIFKIAGHNVNPNQGAGMIPWQIVFTVFWEDLCYGLPLAIFSSALGNETKWKRIVTTIMIIAMMLSFGLGHVYQGYFAAFALSFYIPFTFKKGQEVGFGTIMVGHVLYDLITILTIKNF